MKILRQNTYSKKTTRKIVLREEWKPTLISPYDEPEPYSNWTHLKEEEQHEYTDTREDASDALCKKAKETGVVQKVRGEWRIVSIRKKKLWDAHYKTRESAEAALRAYQAGKH